MGVNKKNTDKIEKTYSGTIKQFIRYSISGGIATIVHIIVFYIIAWKIFPALQENDFVVAILGLSVTTVDVATRSLNSMLSNIITFFFSNMVVYLLNAFWVFESGRHQRMIEILLFYLVSGISLVIGTSIMGLLIKYFGMQTTYAFTANLVTSTLINFVVRKFHIFKG